MGTPAYTKKIKIGSDDAPAESASLNQGGDVLDDTEMATNAGYRSRLYGLRDWSISMSCRWTAGQAALTAIRNAWLNRTTLTVQYLPDGTTANGFEGTVVVENFNMSGDVGGQEMVDISLQADGALGAAS